MGIIKTAMMSGAAVYGVKQVAKAANNHAYNNNRSNNGYNSGGGGGGGNNQQSWSEQRYDYYPDEQPYNRSPSRPFRDEDASGAKNQRYPYDRKDWAGYPDNYPSQQRRYLDATSSYDPDPFPPLRHDQLEQLSKYASRAPQAPPAYYSSPRRQQSFVEPEEIDDQRDGGSRDRQADMLNMLAQQAMSMGLIGGSSGKKDKDSNTDLLSTVFKK